MTWSILLFKKAIMGSVFRLAMPLLSSTCRERAARTGLSGTGMMFSCAFSSGNDRVTTKVVLGAGPLAGLGPELLLNVQTYILAPSLLTETEVGYQPVGIRPVTRLLARST